MSTSGRLSKPTPPQPRCWRTPMAPPTTAAASPINCRCRHPGSVSVPRRRQNGDGRSAQQHYRTKPRLDSLAKVEQHVSTLTGAGPRGPGAWGVPRDGPWGGVHAGILCGVGCGHSAAHSRAISSRVELFRHLRRSADGPPWWGGSTRRPSPALPCTVPPPREACPKPRSSRRERAAVPRPTALRLVLARPARTQGA